MPAGTLTLTNNSDSVSGTGTAFDTEINAGDFIVCVVGGVTYTLPVKAVDSATQVTLIKAYDGPTQSGAAWYAVPREAMSLITAQLAAETAKALRGLNYDKENWQQVFSGTGNITVRLPDGSTYTGPAWNSFTTALNQKAEKKTVDELATDVTKKVNDLTSDVTKKLEDKADKTSLGSAAGAMLQTGLNDATSGRVTTVGSFGVGAIDPLFVGLDGIKPGGFYNIQAILGGIGNNASLLQIPFDGGFGYQIIIPTIALSPPKMFLRLISTTPQYNGQICEVYTTANTTTDGNGFIKKASPIVKLFGDGTTELNAESRSVTAERLREGVYRLSGTLGFNADGGWGGPDGGIDIPLDRNKQPLIWVDYEVEPTGDLLIKTYHRTHPTAPAFAHNDISGYEEGMPIDIPRGRWVDLRVEMPAVEGL